MTADLTPFVPRLVVDWGGDAPSATHRRVPGTLVFTDLTGFTAMSELLAARGKVGSEELTDHLDATFSELLTVAGRFGGSLLKFGGDALLLFFSGEEHEARAARAAIEMQRSLDTVGIIATSAGEIVLRMTVGAHTGDFEFFLVGDTHRELFVCGEAATETVRTEAGAEPGEVRVSQSLADRLDPALLTDHTSDGTLLTGPPPAPAVPVSRPSAPGVAMEGFVPAMLREHLASGVELGEHRQMAVGFIHLSNLDELLLVDGGHRTARWLSDRISHVQSVFDEHGVTFISTDIYEDGPKLICATGAVRTFENDDERVLRALREIADHPSPIDVRIGVHRGHGFSGYVGPWFRRTFVTIGDVVNTAARVMARSARGEMLSTAEPLERSDTLFESQELPPFEAKGKAEPVIAYRIGALTGTREETQRGRLPLIGRERETAMLVPFFHALEHGQGAIVEIVGDAGIGKSRLAEEAISMVDVPFVEQRCGRYAATTPYFPFRTLLGSVIGGRDLQALRRFVTENSPALVPYLPLLAVAIGIEAPSTPEVEALSANQRRARLQSAVRELIEGSITQPTIWLVEDVHWIDNASAELFRHLAQGKSIAPLLICMTRRPEGEPIAPEHTVELGSLTADAAEELVQSAATTHLLPKEIARLNDRAHGNPHFLIALAGAVSSNRDLDQLPDSLEALLAARVDELAPGERRVLRQLAVLGNRFDRWIAQEVVEELPSRPRDRLALSEFINFTSDEWRFIHTLVRDTAYEGLSFRERREVHSRAGRAIESRLEDPDDLCELLSLHFHHAEDHEKSLRYSNQAATKAEAGYAFLEAAIFFGRSVEAARTLHDEEALGEALTGLAHTELDQGHFISARERYEESLEIKRALGNLQGVAAQLNGLGLVARSMGEYTEAEGFLKEALSVLGTLSEPENIEQVLNNLGSVSWYQGRYDDAKRWFEQALDVALGKRNERSIASAFEMLGTVSYVLGDLSEAQQRFEQSLAINRDIGNLPATALTLLNLGNVARQQGSLELARSRWEESLAIERDLGDRAGVAKALNNLGLACYLENDFDGARERWQEGLSIASELGDRRGEAQYLHNLGEVAWSMEDLETAIDLCARALEIRRAIGDQRGVGESLISVAALAAALHRPDESIVTFLEAIDVLTKLGNNPGLAECLLEVARTFADIDPERAATLMGAADEVLASTESVYPSPERRDVMEATLESTLGRAALDRSMKAGRALSVDQAIELVRAFDSTRSVPA